MQKIFPAIAIASLTIVGCTIADRPSTEIPSMTQEYKEADNQTVKFSDGSLELEFPTGWYENESKHPYDLQYFSGNQRMNTGVFLYKSEDLTEVSTPENVFEWQIDDLRSNRKNFTIVEPIETEALPDKNITTAVYAGEKDISRFHYKLSLVEFAESSEQFLVTIQVAIPSEWDTSKPILEGIIRSAKLSSARM